MMRITPKDWGEFQHYKDRDPSWIKLHKRLLDNYEFQTLHVASRALAPMLWLLASEHKDGVIEATEEKLAFRLRMTVEELRAALKPLIEAKFFSVEHDASTPLAEPERSAIPEKEKQVEKELSSEKLLETNFQTFYDAYPRRESRGAALKAYRQAVKKADPPTILAAAQRFRTSRAGQDPKFTPLPATWLNAEKWADDPTGVPAQPSKPRLDATHPDGWRDRLRRFSIRGSWPPNWGPKPNEDGCLCPSELLAEFEKEKAA